LIGRILNFLSATALAAFTITPKDSRTGMNALKAYRIAAQCLALSLAVAPIRGFAASASRSSEVDAATATQTAGKFSLENRVIGAKWAVAKGRVGDLAVVDRKRGTEVRFAMPFALLLKDGTILDANSFVIAGVPASHELTPHADASRMAERLHGERFDLPLESSDHSVRVVWSLILLDGSNYLRQALTISAAGQDIPIRRVQLIDLPLAGARVSGSVSGSPIVAENLFLGFEHPLAQSKVTGIRATAWIDRDLPLRAGQSVTYSSVIGVARAGQMRRDFLAYLERERAHPYRTFLHYNSWYDLGYFTPYSETDALARVNAFGRELTQKRAVKLDSFLFDDGWDDHKSLWKFNDGFPNGFAAVKDAAEKYGAHPGIWMSPWGGYSKPKQERIEFGKAAGYEIIANGYALSGPKYYAAFRDVCMEMVRKYGVNQFKFDGTGNVDSVFPDSRFDSDYSAAIHLIGELRDAKPDIFINLTTGTWPSPFWLMHADSIWRGGDDDSTAGVGTYRERWITYRDAQTYQRVVQMGPLYPLNSLMLHGIIYAQDHKNLDKDPENDFRNEVRSYFGTGTQLQEMYITPALLSEANWNDLAEAAKWSRANADVLKDTHWIGGDPAWLEVYGWASWNTRKGILVLRNPNNKEQTIRIKLQDAFELPPEAAQVYAAQSPWKDGAGRATIVLHAREPHEFHLAPFEVLTLDILPKRNEHD
jgi:hypothetical protein